MSEGQRLACEVALASDAPLPDATWADARAVMLRLLETLPADDRLVLSLLHLEEKSVEEIAGLLGWSLALVKVRAFRARATEGAARGRSGKEVSSDDSPMREDGFSRSGSGFSLVPSGKV